MNPSPRALTISKNPPLPGCKLRADVIGGRPAGSSAAGVESFLFERSPSVAKTYGDAIPICMLDEPPGQPRRLPGHRDEDHLAVEPRRTSLFYFGKTVRPHEFIAMLRREVDSFHRTRAELIPSLVTDLELPRSSPPIQQSPATAPKLREELNSATEAAPPLADRPSGSHLFLH